MRLTRFCLFVMLENFSCLRGFFYASVCGVPLLMGCHALRHESSGPYCHNSSCFNSAAKNRQPFAEDIFGLHVLFCIPCGGPSSRNGCLDGSRQTMSRHAPDDLQACLAAFRRDRRERIHKATKFAEVFRNQPTDCDLCPGCILLRRPATCVSLRTVLHVDYKAGLAGCGMRRLGHVKLPRHSINARGESGARASVGWYYRPRTPRRFLVAAYNNSVLGLFPTGRLAVAAPYWPPSLPTRHGPLLKVGGIFVAAYYRPPPTGRLILLAG